MMSNFSEVNPDLWSHGFLDLVHILYVNGIVQLLRLTLIS